ncbi:phage portal protein, partial [Actinokineospora sp.]|uniref:phage portal protein n=1 Tax=Actinokineospora sp. TaxID=1872133 RepID=UPI003D6A68D5
MFAEMQQATGTTATRSQALSVPAVRRGRNLICSVATMPLEQLDPTNMVAASALLRQIDPDVANIVTISQTVEDLLFDGISWWLVTANDVTGYPVAARHLDVGSVSIVPPANGQNPAPLPSGIDPRGGVVWVDGQPVGGSRMIRFDSPNPAVLKHAGREIRRAIALDKAAVMYADDPRPADYFEPADGADEVDDDEVNEILATWKAARRKRSTAYVPAALKYHSVDSPAPRDLQLVELQRQVNLDIANALGIDPEDLGISTTSRTYSNDVDRRRNKLNEVLSPYMRGITDRLSMGDVTRRGYTVRFNTTEYLLPNPTERWSTYATAKGLGAITVPEIREAEGMPPLPESELEPATPPPPDQTAEPAPPAEEAVTVSATRPTSMTFDDSRGLMFIDVPVSTFSVNREGRTIEGLALPYGELASQNGMAFRFDRGALTWDADNPGRVKLLRDHDPRQAIGRAIQLKDTPTGLLARFKVARGPEGDRALELAEDGVLDGFSVGVDFDAGTDTVPDPQYKGALLVRRADWRETSLTAMPSFDNARVTKVAASRNQGETAMPCQACGQVHAEGVACTASTTTDQTTEAPAGAGVQLTSEQLSSLFARPGALQAITAPAAGPAENLPAVPEGGLTLSSEQVDSLVQSGHLGLLLGLPGAGLTAAPAVPEHVERPEVVNPARSGTVEFVREALPYRFDRNGSFQRAEHEFSTDLHEMALAKDLYGVETDAGKRVMG